MVLHEWKSGEFNKYTFSWKKFFNVTANYFLQDCTLKVLCGTKDIPSITSNTFGNAKNIPLEDSIPSSVTINPEGLLYMNIHL